MINVAKDFNRFPAGRIPSDGPNSGERFRNEFLVPALTSSDQVVIQLDGTRGYGSSFLDEAFGHLVRAGIFSSDEMVARVKLESSDPSLMLEIQSYFYWPRLPFAAVPNAIH